MADNTPVVDPATSAPKAEIQPEATTEEITPKFAKGLEENKEEKIETPETSVPVEAPVPQEEQAVEDKRLSKAISEVEKRNEEVRKHVELQAEFVRDNNELIHKVAATDPRLANQIVEKVWGVQGIRSYKQLLERSKLEDLKATDPDAYETKRELWEMKNRLATTEEKERKAVRAKFLQDNGIMDNEYDPNYRKLMEAMDSLNSSVVSEDYEKALRMGKSIAFADDLPVVKTKEAPTLQIGGGKKPAPLPSSKPAVSDQTSWLAESLNRKLGYKIAL